MLIDTARKEGLMNMLNCVLMIVWTASLSFKCAYGVTKLENVYAPEGGSAHFPWLSLSPFTTVDWYDGGATSTIMMEYSPSGLDKSPDYNIEYINETNSVGMILRDIKKDKDSGLYTVKVVLTTGPTEQSDTNLMVLTAEEIQECENSKNVKINDVEVACGDSNVKPGSMKISSSMTCLLDKVLMVNCSEDSSGGSTSSCGDCSQLPCELPEFNVVANTKVTLTFWSGKWQGSEFKCAISVTVDTTVSIITAAPSSTFDGFLNTSTTALSVGGPADSRDVDTDYMLNTLDDKPSTLISPFITNDEKRNDNVKETNAKLAIWQIVLIIVGGVFFIIFMAIIIISCRHKDDKKYFNKRHMNRRHQPQTRSSTNDTHLKDRHSKTPQNKRWIHQYTSPVAYGNQTRIQESFPEPVARYPYRITDSDLLVAEGPHSFINIRSNHENKRYPFSHITTRYPGSYVKTNLRYEPEPDYFL